jgi:hypothetical protein
MCRRHAEAFLRATPAGLGALLAMIHLMLRAFIGAYFANSSTQLA